MTLARRDTLFGAVALLALVVPSHACRDLNAVETRVASLRNTETYSYPIVVAGGDEDGATISIQARHYRVSEIRRNAETSWIPTYVYQSLPGYVGSDYVEIEIFTGSDGASAPTNITKVAFHFRIHD